MFVLKYICTTFNSFAKFYSMLWKHKITITCQNYMLISNASKLPCWKGIKTKMQVLCTVTLHSNMDGLKGEEGLRQSLPLFSISVWMMGHDYNDAISMYWCNYSYNQNCLLTSFNLTKNCSWWGFFVKYQKRSLWGKIFALVSMANLTGSWIPQMTKSTATVRNTRVSKTN